MLPLFMNKYRSGLPTFLLAFLVLGMAPSFAAETQDPDDWKKVEVKQVSDLAADAEEANKKQVPVLIMFSLTHCGYCRVVEEDFLKPMLRNAEYEGKVLIRKIKLDGTKYLRDFNGKMRDPEELSDEYHISMVPTLILFDSRGKRLSDPIIGLANPHYYGGDLDAAIDASLLKIRAIAQR